MTAELSSYLPWAARSLAVDGLTAAITARLEDRGVPVIVLKGPAIAQWLYEDAVRAYGDADLLVSPGDWGRASEVLRELGFRDALEPLEHPRMESESSYPWKRGNDDVDLHSTLWGIGAEPAEVWEVLSERTAEIEVGGRLVPVLAPGPRALHVALHLAQHGPEARKPLADLRRAVARLPFETWEEAAEVAGRLRATGAFAAGLSLLPEGRELARRLGVADMASVDALIRAGYVPLAEGFQALATTPGLGRKLALVRRELFPSAEFMRWWSPLARRGTLGLAATYLWRPLWIALRAGPGFVAWRRARLRVEGRANR